MSSICNELRRTMSAISLIALSIEAMPPSDDQLLAHCPSGYGTMSDKEPLVDLKADIETALLVQGADDRMQRSLCGKIGVALLVFVSTLIAHLAVLIGIQLAFLQRAADPRFAVLLGVGMGHHGRASGGPAADHLQDRFHCRRNPGHRRIPVRGRDLDPCRRGRRKRRA